MKSKVCLLGLSLLVFAGCKSNPHKAEHIDTNINNSDVVSGETSVGVKNGDMIVQRKVMMGEEVRRIQDEVYELEDHVYGNRKYGSLGLYGVLRDCHIQLSEPRYGGDGKLKWMEPIDRVTDKEDDFKIGLDDRNKLVGVSEEYLKDRILRFRQYKSILQKREDEYDEKLAICKAQVKAHRKQNGEPDEMMTK